LTTAFTGLAVANGLVFGSLEEPVGGLWALRQRDGTFAWQFGGPEGPSTLTVANGVIYRVDIDGRLIAADASDGVRIAFFGTTGTEEFNDGPVVVNGSVYLGALIACGGSYCWALERWSV
jgi:outer membrane protein assembly factor BamB